MNVRNRLTRLEGRFGINKINVADSLADLKRRAQAGEKTRRTPEELKQLIAECQNEGLRELYQALLWAVSKSNAHRKQKQ